MEYPVACDANTAFTGPSFKGFFSQGNFVFFRDGGDMRSDNLYSFVSLLCREEPRFVDGFDVQSQKALLACVKATFKLRQRSIVVKDQVYQYAGLGHQYAGGDPIDYTADDTDDKQ